MHRYLAEARMAEAHRNEHQIRHRMALAEQERRHGRRGGLNVIVAALTAMFRR